MEYYVCFFINGWEIFRMCCLDRVNLGKVKLNCGCEECLYVLIILNCY